MEELEPGPGQRVRFTLGPLGVLDSVEAWRFERAIVVYDGDEGEVYGPHPNLSGWLLVTVMRPGIRSEPYYVPVHRGGVEPIEPDDAAAPKCPSCGRIMSNREAAEQGACNDCSGGAYDPGARWAIDEEPYA